MTKENAMERTISRGKRIVLGVIGGILILLTAGPPDYEAFMTITGWTSDLDGGAHKLHIIMRGFAALFIGVAAGAVLILKPSWSIGVLYAWIAAAIAYPAAAILGVVAWPPAFIMPIIAIIIAAAILWAYRGQLPWRQTGEQRAPASKSILTATAVIAIPLIVYALNEASLQRSSETLHGNLWHWAGGTKMALLIILLGVFAALRHPGWRVPAWGAGYLLACFGAVSAALPNQASSAGVTWGVLALIGGLAFIVVTEYENRTASVPVKVPPVQPAGS